MLVNVCVGVVMSLLSLLLVVIISIFLLLWLDKYIEAFEGIKFVRTLYIIDMCIFSILCGVLITVLLNKCQMI